ncbi:MAG: hypothetical protein CMP61_12275 [Flavobacteriales bacterium]|nr:hypothetical protein [Flavobacteriales bacterium]
MIGEYYLIALIIGMVVFYKTTIPRTYSLLGLSILFLGLFNWHAGITVILLTLFTFFLQKSKRGAWVGIFLHVFILVFANFSKLSTGIFQLGLSYYSLQNIGILLNRIRDQGQKHSIWDLLVANTFFAKFLSGPILLPKEMNLVGLNNKWNINSFHGGINRICFGLFKKMVLADNLSVMTSAVFQHPESEFKAITILLASLLFTVEMYLNFSAYTDIALGIAKLFNIRLKENFNLPLRSNSISEYWRKTHISLIDWFTHNFFYYFTFKWRAQPIKAVITGITVTFILSGLWHGLELGYLIWGGLNALYLIVEYIGKRKDIQLPKTLGWFPTLFFVSFANLFFVSKYWMNSLHYLRSICSPSTWRFTWDKDVIAILGNGGYLAQQFQLITIASLLILFLIFEKHLEFKAKSSDISITFLTLLILLIFIVGNFNDGSSFIYMQF